MICPSCKGEIHKVIVIAIQHEVVRIPLLETPFKEKLISKISLRGVRKSLSREIKKKDLIDLEIQCPLCHAILNNEIGLVK